MKKNRFKKQFDKEIIHIEVPKNPKERRKGWKILNKEIGKACTPTHRKKTRPKSLYIWFTILKIFPIIYNNITIIWGAIRGVNYHNVEYLGSIVSKYRAGANKGKINPYILWRWLTESRCGGFLYICRARHKVVGVYPLCQAKESNDRRIQQSPFPCPALNKRRQKDETYYFKDY